MSPRILLLQRNPRTPTLSPVAKRVTTDGPSTADITPPGTHPCIPPPMLKARGTSYCELGTTRDEHLYLVPRRLQGRLNFVPGGGELRGFSSSRRSFVGV